jgi:hypothetical protein
MGKQKKRSTKRRNASLKINLLMILEWTATILSIIIAIKELVD